jgi:hypothetical protein
MRALQAAEKLIQRSNFKRFVSGHDFSHAAKALEAMLGFSPCGLWLSNLHKMRVFPQPL